MDPQVTLCFRTNKTSNDLDDWGYHDFGNHLSLPGSSKVCLVESIRARSLRNSRMDGLVESGDVG